MRSIAAYTMIGALAGATIAHAAACYTCYDYLKEQGYSTGTCAASSTIYTGFISQPLAMLGGVSGGLLGLSFGSITYVVRKRRSLDNILEENEDGPKK
jgi:hypothetical protein